MKIIRHCLFHLINNSGTFDNLIEIEEAVFLGFAFAVEIWEFTLRIEKMAGLPARIRLQPTDVKAAALWGVTAVTGALYLVQVNIPFLSLRYYDFLFSFLIFSLGKLCLI